MQKRLWEKEERDCFYQPWSSQRPTFVYGVPTLTLDGQLVKGPDRQPDQTIKVANKRGFEDILLHTSRKLPDKSAYEVWDMFYDEVCPTAFIDSVMATLMNVEATLSEYQGAIGNMFDDANRTAMLGFYMEYADFIEAMDIIRGSKAAYMEHQRELAEAKANSKQPKARSNVIE